MAESPDPRTTRHSWSYRSEDGRTVVYEGTRRSWSLAIDRKGMSSSERRKTRLVRVMAVPVVALLALGCTGLIATGLTLYLATPVAWGLRALSCGAALVVLRWAVRKSGGWQLLTGGRTVPWLIGSSIALAFLALFIFELCQGMLAVANRHWGEPGELATIVSSKSKRGRCSAGYLDFEKNRELRSGTSICVAGDIYDAARPGTPCRLGVRRSWVGTFVVRHEVRCPGTRPM